MSFVYRKKLRESQKYRILYDDGTFMESLEDHMEAAPEGDSDAYSEESTVYDNETETQMEDREDRPPYFDPRVLDSMYADVKEESDEDDETIIVGGVHYQVTAKKKQGNDVLPSTGDGILEMGEVVEIGDLKWKRIEGLPEDVRTEPHLPTTFKTDLFHDET